MRRVVVVMLVVAIALDAAYWTIWFAQRDWIASEHTRAYYDFENAFPLADLWLGLACVMALVTLVRRHPMALFWLIAVGAAGLYLGAMDLLYDLEHGIFGKGGGGAFEAVIVAVTWIFSITVLRYAWTRRGELLGGDVTERGVRNRGAPSPARRLAARGSHHRHRRPSQRRQVHALQCADQERRARGELPVRHDRAERRRRRRPGCPAEAARRADGVGAPGAGHRRVR